VLIRRLVKSSHAARRARERPKAKNG